MILSNSLFLVHTQHGNAIVYSLQPQHLNDVPNTTLVERCMMYGERLAVKHNGEWFKPGMKTAINDIKTIALLERVPNA